MPDRAMDLRQIVVNTPVASTPLNIAALKPTGASTFVLTSVMYDPGTATGVATLTYNAVVKLAIRALANTPASFVPSCGIPFILTTGAGTLSFGLTGTAGSLTTVGYWI